MAKKMSEQVIPIEELGEIKKEVELWKRASENNSYKAFQLKQENAELKDRIEEMRSALERWYKQYSDKNYTETFYSELITDTEILLWSNTCVK